MEHRIRGQKPFHDDCWFVAAEKPSPYQLNELLNHCTEVMWDDTINSSLVGFRVNKTDWNNFTKATVVEGVTLVKK